MKTVILCGGKGTRMGALSESLPKPLVKIGDKPVLWHIMKIYSHYGFNEFVLCLGYKGKLIKEYFAKHNNEAWEINFVETGENSSKSQRLAKIGKFVKGPFFLAYGDDVADIDLKELLKFHQKNNKIGTITAVRPQSPFGVMNLSKDGAIESFEEKPVLDQWINGGFMVLEEKIFDFLKLGELEEEVFKKLVKEKQLNAFRHYGKWKAMNTLKDNIELNELWQEKKSFWKAWK